MAFCVRPAHVYNNRTFIEQYWSGINLFANQEQRNISSPFVSVTNEKIIDSARAAPILYSFYRFNADGYKIHRCRFYAIRACR